MQILRIEWPDREKHNLAASRQRKTAPLLTFISVLFLSLVFKSLMALLLVESGANLLLEAAYEAEVLAFTNPIMGGFARTGLNPCDRDVMWHRFTLNTCKFLSTSRADEMRAAASAVISQAQENTKECHRPSRQIHTGTVSTPIDAVFCPV